MITLFLLETQQYFFSIAIFMRLNAGLQIKLGFQGGVSNKPLFKEFMRCKIRNRYNNGMILCM